MGRSVRRRWEAQVHLRQDRKEVASKLTKAMADKDAGMVFDAGSLRVGDYLGQMARLHKGYAEEAYLDSTRGDSEVAPQAISRGYQIR